MSEDAENTPNLCFNKSMERDLQDIKEEIRTRTDLVELIGNYTRLKRAGKNWTGLCPFHADKNPSFSVSPSIGIYKCWSCGESGDLFKFVQKKENLEFIEALEFLAKRAGVEFERRAPGNADPQAAEKQSEREESYELNRIAVEFFQDRFFKSEVAQAYLTQRGIHRTTQEQFGIGFAPPEWEALNAHLQHKRLNLTLAARIGLIKPRKEEGSGFYDSFRNRLMFPIFDLNGRVIAFGGRTLSADPKEAKYLNSEQSPLFDKSRTLYGLNFARKKLSPEVSPVFVEGYLDVVQAHQAGFAQCIATLGTSMTEQHAQMLVRYSPKVIICYDSDNAGIKATLRGAGVWEAVGVNGAEVRVAILPPGDDPDSILRRGDVAGFQKALDLAVPRIDFEIELVRRRHDLATDAGKLAALEEIIPILATLTTHLARAHYVQNLVPLHPLYHSYGIERVTEQMLADIQQYAQKLSARDKGYPETTRQNGNPLTNQPEPPAYRPATADGWGSVGNPPGNKRPGSGGYSGNNYRPNGQGKDGKPWRRRDEPTGPPTDPSIPPTTPPVLTRVEKVERQILRALFTVEWRSFILSRLHQDYLPSEAGKVLYERVARTPANEEGKVDEIALLNLLEREEAERETEPVPEKVLDDPYAEENNATFFQISGFLRRLMEESSFGFTNEPLNETMIQECITALQNYRKERETRQLAEWLKRGSPQSEEERHEAIRRYQEQARQNKVPPPEESE